MFDNHHRRRLFTRRCTTVSLAVTGAIFIVAGLVLEFVTPELRVAGNLVTIGVLFILFSAVMRKGRSIEEAYSFGYDLGYEMGWRERDADQPPPPPQTVKHPRWQTRG